MGYMRHQAIIVTGWHEERTQAAHAMALEIQRAAEETMDIVSPLGPVVTNGYRTFLIGPDGSKEGWSTSDAGNQIRKQWIEWAEMQRYSDGSTSLEWAEVIFGDEDGPARISASSDYDYTQNEGA